MRTLFKWLRVQVPVRYWVLINAFLTLGLGWGHAIAWQPPTTYGGVLDLSLIYRMGFVTAAGSLIAVIGLFMTRSMLQNRQHKGLWVELVGTVLMALGPFQYLLIQLGFLIQGDFDNRYALVWFAYTMCTFMLVRFAILGPALIESSRKAHIQTSRVR